MPPMAAGTVSPDSSTAVTLKPRLRASRRASDRRLPFQLGGAGNAAASALFAGGSALVPAARGAGVRLATVSFGGDGAGEAGFRGAVFGSDASGTDGERGFAAVASIFVMTMNAVALTARQAVVRMIVFNMASSPSRRGRLALPGASQATCHENARWVRGASSARVLDVRRSVKILFCRTPT